FLDQACRNDPQARATVEGLLTAYEAAGSFLELPAADLQPLWSESRSTEVTGETAPGPAAPRELQLDFLLPAREPGHLGRLAHYEVLGVIGHGGMGIVLKAIDENLQRIVAIKVLAPQLATSATARKRFTREAQAAAAINHENIVDIHAVEEFGPVPYLVMEMV